VIGFEGTITPQRVPARLAAIIVDDVGLRYTARDGAFTRLSDDHLDELPATATRIDPAIPAPRPGSDFLVLAAPDVARCKWSVRFDPESTRPLAGGAYTAWLCNPREANDALRLLGSYTMTHLSDALRKGDAFALYDFGWRMARCATSNDDLFLAAAALASSPHPEQASFLIAGALPAMTPVERDRRIVAADERLRRMPGVARTAWRGEEATGQVQSQKATHAASVGVATSGSETEAA
jgi:hypothetical protein